MIKSTCLFFTISLLLFASCKSPQTKDTILENIPDPKTLSESYVSNPDHILSPETVSTLNNELSKLDQSGTAHIDVVFVQSIGDHVPKDIAHNLFRKWKIGRKDTNNGLLILMVKDQKRIEFETGYGLEGVLPDMICKRIQEDNMIPYAKNNDFDGAILSGVDALMSKLKNEEQPGIATADTATVATLMPQTTETDPGVTDLPPSSSATNQTPFIQDPPSSSPSKHGPGLIALLVFIPVLIFYIGIATALGSSLYGYRFKKKWLNPFTYFLVLVPPALAIWISFIDPLSGFWFILRNLAVFYLFLLIYIHLHFLILSTALKSALKGLSLHEQYLKWQETHAPMERAVLKIFPYPFLKFYWKSYKERLYQLRNSPLKCEKCAGVMICLDDDQEDQFLSKGQLTEERIDSIDYDVWECTSCKEHLILDYKNIKSQAKECPECHFITLKFDKRKVIKSATTYSEGYGYIYSICANCKFKDAVKFEIAKISISSDDSSSSSSFSSSSSSSSSSDSTSSGGSSGGGGAGSSW